MLRLVASARAGASHGRPPTGEGSVSCQTESRRLPPPHPRRANLPIIGFEASRLQPPALGTCRIIGL
jgi:hypothetical protein